MAFSQNEKPFSGVTAGGDSPVAQVSPSSSAKPVATSTPRYATRSTTLESRARSASTSPAQGPVPPQASNNIGKPIGGVAAEGDSPATEASSSSSAKPVTTEIGVQTVLSSAPKVTVPVVLGPVLEPQLVQVTNHSEKPLSGVTAGGDSPAAKASSNSSAKPVDTPTQCHATHSTIKVQTFPSSPAPQPSAEIPVALAPVPVTNHNEKPFSGGTAGGDSPAAKASSSSSAKPVDTPTRRYATRSSIGMQSSALSPAPQMTPPLVLAPEPALPVVMAPEVAVPIPPLAVVLAPVPTAPQVPTTAPRSAVAADTSLALRVPKTFAQIKGRCAIRAASAAGTLRTDRNPPQSSRKAAYSPKKAMKTKDIKVGVLKRRHSDDDLQPSTSAQAAKNRAKDNSEAPPSPKKPNLCQVYQMTMRNRPIGMIIFNSVETNEMSMDDIDLEPMGEANEQEPLSDDRESLVDVDSLVEEKLQPLKPKKRCNIM